MIELGGRNPSQDLRMGETVQTAKPKRRNRFVGRSPDAHTLAVHRLPRENCNLTLGGQVFEFDQAARRSESRAFAIGFSIFLHVLILLALNFWRIFEWPRVASGFVINSEFQTDDDGAESVDSAIIHSADASDGDDQRQGPSASSAAVMNLWEQSMRSKGSGNFVNGSGASSGGIGFFGTRGVGNSFVFVVDCSGSMQENNRLGRAQHELNRAIQELNPRQKFTVIFFNGGTHPFLDSQPPRLVDGTKEWRRRAHHWVNDRDARGDTLPENALQIALRLQPDVIFFLTDGEIPEDTPKICVQSNDSSTVIHTTAFHSQVGEKILTQISRDSKGTYRFIKHNPESDPVVVDFRKLSKAQKRETAAKRYFTMTKTLLKNGRSRTAKRRLKLIVREYADLDVSKEAQQILETMTESSKLLEATK